MVGKIIAFGGLVVIVMPMVLLAAEMVRFGRGKAWARKQFENDRAEKFRNWGATERLEILPLIDWYAAKEGLLTEGGVSYLLKTDTRTILFDLGFNYPARSHPSPLLQNMARLGIRLDDIDTIVISHDHPDHVGGRKWQARKSFSLSSTQVDLGGTAVYTPVPMTYPGLQPVVTEAPTRIGEGIATIGTIPNQLFMAGWTVEQALAVNVAGKGVVLIVGCGHQTLPRILERTEALFDEPIYGVVGGLHYPVSDSRIKPLGFKIQKYLGTGKVPWQPITRQEVFENIACLQKRHPRLVGLSPHDSCDESLDAFRTAFPQAYRDIRVGEAICVSRGTG